MNNLAIIPARSGSKGLKDKNIKELCGKPLIAYSIEAAKETGLYSHIMISTDSKKYADIGKEYGAEVPFYRSENTSNDSASSWDVVREVLDNYEQMGIIFDSFSLLQPTSPLRTSSDIINAYSIMKENNAIGVVSVCECEHSPLWSNILPADNSLNGFIDIEKSKQRQQLKKYYRINGAIYMANVDAFRNNPNLYRENCYAYIMPTQRSVDIDNEIDFALAKLIKELEEKSE